MPSNSQIASSLALVAMTKLSRRFSRSAPSPCMTYDLLFLDRRIEMTDSGRVRGAFPRTMNDAQIVHNAAEVINSSPSDSLVIARP